VSGGDHCWFEGSTGKERHVTGDINIAIIIDMIVCLCVCVCVFVCVCVCAELRCNMCKEIGEELENKHLYDFLQKLVETGHDGKFTV